MQKTTWLNVGEDVQVSVIRDGDKFVAMHRDPATGKLKKSSDAIQKLVEAAVGKRTASASPRPAKAADATPTKEG